MTVVIPTSGPDDRCMEAPAAKPLAKGDRIKVRLVGQTKVSTIVVENPDLWGDGLLGQGFVPSRKSPGDYYGGLRLFYLSAVVEVLS